MGTKILEIETGWKLGFSLENIVVDANDRKINIPVSDINTLMINNITTLCSVKILNELSTRNVLVILCNEKHLPTTLILPISGNYNSLKKIESQIKWSEEFKNKCWEKVLKLKINGQFALLKHLNLLPKKIEEYVKKQKIIDYSIEAQVAATYFKILYGESFERRSEKDEINTIINSFLNYGYTILMSAMARSIIKSGYDCRISLFHKSFSNHTALASDLMEPFRPCVDWCVYQILRTLKTNSFILNSEVKKKLIDLFTTHIIYNNERVQIFSAIDKFVYDIIEKNENIKFEYIYDEY